MARQLGSREKIMPIVLGGIAVVAVAVLFLFGGGSGSSTESPSSTPRFFPGPHPLATQTATPIPTQGNELGTVAKDPFMPAGGYAQPAGPPPAGGGGTASPTPQPSGGVRGHSKVVLVDVYSSNGVRFASVQVDGQTHNVKEGDTFANVYRVVTITDKCATFVQGDERFTLCIGQQVFK